MLCLAKDATWQKFEFECANPAQIGNFQTIIQQVISLHTQLPITRIRLTNDIFRIDFANGKIWRMKYWTLEANPDVSYILDSDTTWKRDFISQYIIPIVNSLSALRFNLGVIAMDGIIL